MNHELIVQAKNLVRAWMPGVDPALADDLLDLLPDLRKVREHGHGQIVIKYQDGEWVSIEGTTRRVRVVRKNGGRLPS